MTLESIVNFRTPPISEVVCGVKFEAPAFSSVHFGLYWSSIREQFGLTTVDQPPLLDDEIGFASLPPLRRVWYESNDKTQLIQLQKDRFLYNWRKRHDRESYPRFEIIYPAFIKEWLHFQEWYKKETSKSLLIPIRYELTYVNKIDESYGWSSYEDTKKILATLNKEWVGFLEKPTINQYQLHFILPDNSGTLVANVNQVTTQPKRTEALILELTATSTSNMDEFKAHNIENWFRLAHDSIVRAFLDLTRTDTQEEQWGKYE